MSKKESRLEKAQRSAEEAIRKTNEAIERLGCYSSELYDELGVLQDRFDSIRNMSEDERLEYERVKKVRLSWKRQAEKIEADYAAAKAAALGKGVAGAGAGVAVAAMGPTAAMGVATTFGVASTGTAISTLSGAAATNAALAWLGGGALAAGGGGMAAGEAFLALAGPIGWAIAGVALLGSGAMLIKGKIDQGRIEQVFTLVSKRDEKSYELAIIELEERMRRIENETNKIKEAIARVEAFGLDYNEMTEQQQYELGSYVNLMNSSTQLLINPILGLQPKFTEEDLDELMHVEGVVVKKEIRPLVVSLCNFLYDIEFDNKDSSLLYKSFRKNKSFLGQFALKKSDLDESVFETVKWALNGKRKQLEDCS